MVGARELDRRVRVRRVAREEDAADEEEIDAATTPWTGAIRSSQIAEAAGAERASCASARSPTAAAESAPTSAPAPNAAEMIPNVRGPPSSVFFASRGSRMLKLKQIDAKTAIIASVTCTVAIAARVREALRVCRAQIVGRRRPVERIELGDAHREQRGEHGEEARGVDREAPAGADRGDHDAGERGAEDAREVEEARVERDRVRQLVLADHLEGQVLARRCVEHDARCR